MPEKITSPTNPKIKRVVKLRQRKGRESLNLTLVEGIKEMRLALESGIVFEEIYLCPDVSFDGEAIKPLLKADTIYEVSLSVYEKLAFGDRQEGIIGICSPPQTSLGDWPQVEHPLYVVLDKIEKPGNIGAILRSCDGAGVDGIIVVNPKTDLFNPNIVRASLGTVFTNRIAVGSDEDVLAFLTEKSVQICVSVPESNVPYTNCDYKMATAVVMGSEDKGVGSFWRQHADKELMIPMTGKADSLNVSTSTAIIIYEALRQRHN